MREGNRRDYSDPTLVKFPARIATIGASPSVKQKFAAIRMLFDWLVTGGVLPTNPAAAVRGPKHVVKVGRTPVLTAGEAARCSIRSRSTRLPDCATGR